MYVESLYAELFNVFITCLHHFLIVFRCCSKSQQPSHLLWKRVIYSIVQTMSLMMEDKSLIEMEEPVGKLFVPLLNPYQFRYVSP